MSRNEVITALRETLQATPDNVPLRKHLADLLLKAAEYHQAEQEFRKALSLAPDDNQIKLGLAETFYYQQKHPVALVIVEELLKEKMPSAQTFLLAARLFFKTGEREEAKRCYQSAKQHDANVYDDELETLQGNSPSSETQDAVTEVDNLVRVLTEDVPDSLAPPLEHSTISFADVGGMDTLKEEINMKILHPLNHPEIYKAYGKSIGGGILLYGPPGCGKTYLARATAGEVDAYFISVGIHDVLNLYLGQSEQNLHELFELARSNTPCVLFFDEVDALGAKRSDMRQSAGRQLINQFLSELDGINSSNEGILILAATNAPWHLDSAFRRPGRFDRVLFVPPPDLPARTAILRVMLQNKPVEEIDYQSVSRKTEGFSGADLKAVVDVAIEEKLHEAIKKGNPSPLTTKDLLTSAKKIKPTAKEWFATARNYALYSNQSGIYDEILTYLKLS